MLFGKTRNANIYSTDIRRRTNFQRQLLLAAASTAQYHPSDSRRDVMYMFHCCWEILKISWIDKNRVLGRN